MFSTNQSSAFILDQQQSAVYRSRSLLLAESHCFLHLCENGQISIYWFRFQRFLLFCLMEFCFLHVYWWNWASQRWQPADNTTATVTMVFVLATLSDCTEMWRRVLLFCFTVDIMQHFQASVQQHTLAWSGLFAATFSPLPAVQILVCFQFVAQVLEVNYLPGRQKAQTY